MVSEYSCYIQSMVSSCCVHLKLLHLLIVSCTTLSHPTSSRAQCLTLRRAPLHTSKQLSCDKYISDQLHCMHPSLTNLYFSFTCLAICSNSSASAASLRNYYNLHWNSITVVHEQKMQICYWTNKKLYCRLVIISVEVHLESLLRMRSTSL